jgi:hypothetical protein
MELIAVGGDVRGWTQDNAIRLKFISALILQFAEPSRGCNQDAAEPSRGCNQDAAEPTIHLIARAEPGQR